MRFVLSVSLFLALFVELIMTVNAATGLVILPPLDHASSGSAAIEIPLNSYSPRRRARNASLDEKRLASIVNANTVKISLPSLLKRTQNENNLESPFAQSFTVKGLSQSLPIGSAQFLTRKSITQTDTQPLGAPLPSVCVPSISFTRSLEHITQLWFFTHGGLSEDFARSILSNKSDEQCDFMTSHLIKIFDYFKGERMGTQLAPRINISAREAHSIMSSISALFMINDAYESVPATCFIELNYTNRDPTKAVLLVEMMVAFCIKHVKKGKKVGTVRNELMRISDEMNREFYYTGKLTHNNVTLDYFAQLLSKMDLVEKNLSDSIPIVHIESLHIKNTLIQLFGIGTETEFSSYFK